MIKVFFFLLDIVGAFEHLQMAQKVLLQRLQHLQKE